jgi:hypothetical protein
MLQLLVSHVVSLDPIEMLADELDLEGFFG